MVMEDMVNVCTHYILFHCSVCLFGGLEVKVWLHTRGCQFGGLCECSESYHLWWHMIVNLSAVCMLQHIQCQAVSKGTSAGYKPVHGCFLSCLMLMFNLLTCSRTYWPKLINEAITSHQHAWQLSGNWRTGRAQEPLNTSSATRLPISIPAHSTQGSPTPWCVGVDSYWSMWQLPYSRKFWQGISFCR